ncbi:Transposase IS200 like protein [compost metagenome]
MKLFNNKYRIDSARLNNWDYSQNAVYFITICSGNKEHYFGEIKDGKMYLSDIGEIADIFLNQIPDHFNFTAIDAYVVMPNHIHILLVINRPVSKVEILHSDIIQKGITDEDIFINVRETLQCNVSTDGKNEFMAQISPKKGSVSTIIRSYKSAVSKEARTINYGFLWQERFHDHIVRNDSSYYKIKNYILDNPANWDKDKFY